LLVEDDDAVREFAREVLKAAAGGGQAPGPVECWRSTKARSSTWW
jgi:hypothetical protein